MCEFLMSDTKYENSNFVPFCIFGYGTEFVVKLSWSLCRRNQWNFSVSEHKMKIIVYQNLASGLRIGFRALLVSASLTGSQCQWILDRWLCESSKMHPWSRLQFCNTTPFIIDSCPESSRPYHQDKGNHRIPFLNSSCIVLLCQYGRLDCTVSKSILISLCIMIDSKFYRKYIDHQPQNLQNLDIMIVRQRHESLKY